MTTASPPQPQPLSRDETISLVEQLRGGMAQRREWGWICDQLSRACVGTRWPTIVIEGNFPVIRGRVRRCDEPPPPHVDCVSAPPDENASPNRCNRPRKAIFYGGYAGDAIRGYENDAIFAEISADVGDCVALLRCRLREGSKLCFVAVGELDHFRRYQMSVIRHGGVQDAIRSFWNAEIKGKQKDEVVRRLHLDAFFADAFRQPAFKESDYKLCQAITKVLMEDKSADSGEALPVHALAYPSVMHLGGTNIAMKVDAARSMLQPISVELIDVTEKVGFGLFDSKQRMISKEIKDSGEIVW